MVDHIVPYVFADRVGVPDPAEQVLHPVRVASPACSAIVQQLYRGSPASSPAMSARTRRRGSTHPEPAGHQTDQLVEHRLLPGTVYAPTCRHRMIV
jgi:hypothetical protein